MWGSSERMHAGRGQDVLIDAAAKAGTSSRCGFDIVGGPVYRTAGSQFSEEELRQRDPASAGSNPS